MTVGQDGTSTYHLLDDADGANTRNYSDAEAAAVALGGFRVRVDGGATQGTWRNYMGGFNNGTPGQDGRRNVVRYDSPTFAGFSGSASWGEDDIWDMALTYKGEVGDFKLVGKVGYGESNDPSTASGTGANCGVVAGDRTATGGELPVRSCTPPRVCMSTVATASRTTEAFEAVGRDGESTTWFVQAGIERKFVDLGKTTIFGEYRHDNAGFSSTDINLNDGAGGSDVQNSEFNFYAAGIVQNIDAAAMDLYIIYRHSEVGELTNATTTGDIDDFDMLIPGARIQF